MCVGGPPKPVQPSRSQWVAMVASATLSRVTARLPSSTERSLWNRATLSAAQGALAAHGAHPLVSPRASLNRPKVTSFPATVPSRRMVGMAWQPDTHLS